MSVLLARPGRFELSLTLAQGSALCNDGHSPALLATWSLIHYGPRFEPFHNLPNKTATAGVAFLFGAPGGVRTHDLPVRSRALYPLSYGRIGHSGRTRNAYLL